MSQGTLEVRGTLALSQFWPDGGSDADTVSMTLERDGAFRFRSSDDGAWQVTNAFEGTWVDGAVKKAPITPTRKVTLRLVGIDAPELHCTATPRIKRAKQTPEQLALYRQWGRSYRQPLAESAILALRDRLGSESPVLPCVARTRVDHPNEVFDCYGRLVSSLFVETATGELHVNHWLLEQGWAVPSLYDAMSADEIAGILDSADQARTEKRGVWANLADTVTDLDWTLLYRHLHAATKPDAGVVLHPKLFRRLVTWAVNRRTAMGNGSFREYLHRVDERCVRRDDFQSMGSKARGMRLSDWIGEDGQIVVEPAEIVFKEKDSTLIGTDGTRVERW